MYEPYDPDVGGLRPTWLGVIVGWIVIILVLTWFGYFMVYVPYFTPNYSGNGDDEYDCTGKSAGEVCH